MNKNRQKVVDLICSWQGKNEADGSFKSIIDLYNTYKPLPRGIKMQYDWEWCACTWSAIAVALNYTDIMPIEISCGNLTKIAQDMGIWQENDGYVPKPGDAVLYDWQDTGSGDDKGWPDHVGTVIEVYPDAGYFVTMEGNWNNAVSKRTISINKKTLRGFITPKYDEEPVKVSQTSGKDLLTVAKEVISGKWGNGADRKTNLALKGYDYSTVQQMVNQLVNGSSITATNATVIKSQKNKVVASCGAKNFNKMFDGVYTTTADLYCRDDAGTNKKALCLIPKGTKVRCYGYYNVNNGMRWLYIQFTLNNVTYTGFSHSKYLSK